MPHQRASVTIAHAPRRGRKYFTLEEADRALMYVGRVVDDVSVCYRYAVEVRQRLERPHPEDDPEQLKGQYENAMDRLNALIDELHHVGVELKDFEKGLVDFPAVHEGREIHLCWQRGETRIIAWHEVDAGYAGRQSVDLLHDHVVT